MSQLPESLRYRSLSFNDHGRHEITVTPHLSEAIKQRVVSNSAKAFNEVRSHIKFGMLSKISFNLPMKTSVIGVPCSSEISIMVMVEHFKSSIFLNLNYTWFETRNPQETRAVVAPVRA